MNHFNHTDLHTELDDSPGDSPVFTAKQRPVKLSPAPLSEPEKTEQIAGHFAQIMKILGLDMEDDSLRDTPRRVAKMYVSEIFSGLNPANKPKVTTFDNTYAYNRLVIERNIPLQSTCEHHFQPIFGVVHIGYIPNGKVVGLSKLNRIADYYARRPQVQERLTMQIAEELKSALHTDNVAVYIDARHMCVQARGVEHHGASTITAEYSGKFLNEGTKQEFLQAIYSRMP